MKDPRYKAIKSLIEANKVESLQDIFDIIPISTVKVDLKMNYNTLRRRIYNAGLLTLKDIVGLSNLFEVDSNELFKIALSSHNKKSKLVKRKL